MKKMTAVIAAAVVTLGLTTGLAGVEIQFSAGLEISSTRDFVEPLDSYGGWVDVRSYGRCWHPSRVEQDWRPYSDGHWEWTDCGWYWVSDEPWSWACYHYGSWVNDSQYGWVWIPATEWAPAWVNWRESDDYVGWAPCGPRGAVLAPSLFVFVGVGHFHDRFTPRSLVVNDTTIINRTKVITNIRRETRNFDGGAQRVVINDGPQNKRLRSTGSETAAPRPVREVISQTPAPESIKRVRSGPGAIERPVLSPDSRATAPGSAQQIQRPEATRPATSRTVDKNQRSATSVAQEGRTNTPTASSSEPAPRPVAPTPSPTGREQDRLYRENTNTRSGNRDTRPDATSRTLPEQQQPVPDRASPRRSEEKIQPTPPVVPQRNRDTDRDNEKVRETPKPPIETVPREKPLPPTGKDRGAERGANSGERVVPKELPPAERTPAPTPQERNRERGNDRTKDKDKEHP